MDDTTQACEAAEDSSGRRLRELRLTPSDHEHLRDRRRLDRHLQALGAPNTTKGSLIHPLYLHFGGPSGCAAFHCFKGDEDCPDPAPYYACLEWGVDGRCAQPLCRWVSEDRHEVESGDAISALVGRRRLIEYTGVGIGNACTSDVDCGTGGVCQTTEPDDSGELPQGVHTEGSWCMMNDYCDWNLDTYADYDLGCVVSAGHGDAFLEQTNYGNSYMCETGSCNIITGKCSNCICFPAAATTTLPDGSQRRMDELKPGVEVLVILPDGTLTFEPIIDWFHDTWSPFIGGSPAFSHYLPGESFEYVELEAAGSGARLTLSPGHFVPRVSKDEVLSTSSSSSSPSSVAGIRFEAAVLAVAADVRVGDVIFVVASGGHEQGNSSTSIEQVAVPTLVTSVSTAIHRGAYNFHTASGTIVVDDVVASVFTNRSWPLGYGSTLQPLQQWHRWFPSLAALTVH